MHETNFDQSCFQFQKIYLQKKQVVTPIRWTGLALHKLLPQCENLMHLLPLLELHGEKKHTILIALSRIAIVPGGKRRACHLGSWASPWPASSGSVTAAFSIRDKTNWCFAENKAARHLPVSHWDAVLDLATHCKRVARACPSCARQSSGLPVNNHSGWSFMS